VKRAEYLEFSKLAARLESERVEGCSTTSFRHRPVAEVADMLSAGLMLAVGFTAGTAMSLAVVAAVLL
jgi:hypothetical protein